jgi:putative addiction module killer protein
VRCACAAISCVGTQNWFDWPRLNYRFTGQRHFGLGRPLISCVATNTFAKWLGKLKDQQGKLRTLERIDRIAYENSGDVRPRRPRNLGLAANYGPGHRVYYRQDGNRLILLYLGGGDKSSQSLDTEKDINHGKE